MDFIETKINGLLPLISMTSRKLDRYFIICMFGITTVITYISITREQLKQLDQRVRQLELTIYDILANKKNDQISVKLETMNDLIVSALHLCTYNQHQQNSTPNNTPQHNTPPPLLRSTPSLRNTPSPSQSSHKNTTPITQIPPYSGSPPILSPNPTPILRLPSAATNYYDDSISIQSSFNDNSEYQHDELQVETLAERMSTQQNINNEKATNTYEYWYCVDYEEKQNNSNQEEYVMPYTTTQSPSVLDYYTIPYP